MVIAIGVRETGEREVVGFAVGAREEHAFWLEFLRSLVARSLMGVQLIVSDGRRCTHELGGEENPMHSYPAHYQDAQGRELSTIDNDGKQLRLVLRGVEFVGPDFAALESTLDLADPRLSFFTLEGRSLCACHLEWVMPFPVVVGNELIGGQLQVYLELGYPRPDGNCGIDQVTLRLCFSFAGASFWSKGTSGMFEEELRDIQHALPEGAYLQACISCAYSDYSPAGSGLFGTLACFRGNKAAYRQVTDKRSLFAIWNTMTELVQETYLCPEFEHRRPGAGYRG